MILIYSFYIFLFKCILLNVPCLLKPPLAVSPGARSLSSLLAALIIIIIIIIIFQLNRIFEGLNMLEKSRNFAHAPEVAKIYIWYGFKSGCAKWLDSATYTLQRCAPRATFHVHVWKSVHSCNTPIPTKSLLKQNPKPNRKLVIFN